MPLPTVLLWQRWQGCRPQHQARPSAWHWSKTSDATKMCCCWIAMLLGVSSLPYSIVYHSARLHVASGSHVSTPLQHTASCFHHQCGWESHRYEVGYWWQHAIGLIVMVATLIGFIWHHHHPNASSFIKLWPSTIRFWPKYASRHWREHDAHQRHGQQI